MNITRYDLDRDFLYVDIELMDGFTTDDVDVELAVVVVGDEVEESDWTPAEWADDREGAVRMMVGPSSDFGQLEVGRYHVYTRIEASVVRPVRLAGTLRIKATT